MSEKMAGREITLAVNTSQWYFLEGNPFNDEATRAVFYLAAFLDEASKTKVAELRAELGLGKVLNNPHVSLAGVGPTDGDFPKFRQRFCRPRPPANSFPTPYEKLAQNQL